MQQNPINISTDFVIEENIINASTVYTFILLHYNQHMKCEDINLSYQKL